MAASRSIKVLFRTGAMSEEALEAHDIAVSADGTGAPSMLENPHADFPGVWQYVGEADGAYVYAPTDQKTTTADTVG
jgi:hypothetical protein